MSDDLQALVAQGLTRQEIADHLGLSLRQTARHLKDAGLTAARKAGSGRRVSLTRDEVIALVEEARVERWTQRAAAYRAGITRKTLGNLLRRYGVEWS